LQLPPASQAEAERDEGPVAGAATALFTATQRRVLGWLYGQVDRAFHMQEVFAITGTGNGAVQRELRRLEAAGLVTQRTIRGRKYYQANPQCPIYAELAALVQNSFGMAEPLREAFAELGYCAALLFAYVPPDAWPLGHPSLDLVLVLKKDMPPPVTPDVLDALDSARSRLGRGFTLSRIVAPGMLANPDPFLATALAQPRIWVFGHESALAAMTSGP
jgi:hypothetical protein